MTSCRTYTSWCGLDGAANLACLSQAQKKLWGTGTHSWSSSGGGWLLWHPTHSNYTRSQCQREGGHQPDNRSLYPWSGMFRGICARDEHFARWAHMAVRATARSTRGSSGEIESGTAGRWRPSKTAADSGNYPNGVGQDELHETHDPNRHTSWRRTVWHKSGIPFYSTMCHKNTFYSTMCHIFVVFWCIAITKTKINMYLYIWIWDNFYTAPCHSSCSVQFIPIYFEGHWGLPNMSEICCRIRRESRRPVLRCRGGCRSCG